ncbi:hypothetical protein P261_02727 [Lachnospiraceae bacterium TWA4]|nr:hypothetical protein P261_02727 [Lachnospiraceae bacterium TWA4]
MMDQTNLMQKIYELGFAMDDMILYLDTHPEDNNALSYYHEVQKNYQKLWTEYNNQVRPLTNKTEVNTQIWNWNVGKMPWEGGC